MSGRKAADISADRLVLGGRATPWIAGGIAAGAVGILGAVGIAAGSGRWGRFHQAWLVNLAFFLSLALGALFFVLLQHLTRAGWSVVVRRLAEVTASILPLLALLAAPVLLFLPSLYPWAAHAKAIAAKAAYLNVPFFTLRAVFFFAVWIFLALWFYRRSRSQDATRDVDPTRRMERAAAVAALVYAITVTFFAFDWLMSLDPGWSSTIFGVYFFAGCAVGFFAFLPLAAGLLQRLGYMRNAVSLEHYHDLGKLVFAFVVFWAYVAFSQYMLIWYANIPEETAWYAARQGGGWVWVSLLLLAGHFAVPFVLLLARLPKRSPRFLIPVAAWVLGMHWVDLHWLVGAGRGGASPTVEEALLFMGMGGLCLAAAAARLRSAAMVPIGDPRLAESLRFENV